MNCHQQYIISVFRVFRYEKRKSFDINAPKDYFITKAEGFVFSVGKTRQLVLHSRFANPSVPVYNHL